MRNIFLFIRRYFNFVFFVVLQIVALYMLFHYNEFHEAAFMGVSNEITGRVSEKFNNVEYYFHLKKTNEELAKENETLRNMLSQNFQSADTAKQIHLDTIARDTLGKERKYLFRSASVVNKYISLHNNYFTINRGEEQGVRRDMGVISPTGVMGAVVFASKNFSVVMSLLHAQSKVNGKLKKSGETGQVSWDGESPYYLTMKNLPKSVAIAKGDSIVTSQYGSYRFPQGILIGVVSEVVEDKTSNFYTLKLRPATNFGTVEHAMVIENLQAEEQKMAEEAVKKNQ